MKVICYALCFALLVFPLAACQASSASDTLVSDTSSVSDSPNVIDAEFSELDGEQSQNTVMGKVTAINRYIVTVETMGFGYPGQGSRENRPEMSEDFDSKIPEMPDMSDVPEMPEGGEAPGVGGENPPDAESMMKPPEGGYMPFENEDAGESKEFDLENAKIFIEYPDGKVSGSIDDIEVDRVLSIELDEEDNVISVIIRSDFESFTENPVPPMGEKNENSSDTE